MSDYLLVTSGNYYFITCLVR